MAAVTPINQSAAILDEVSYTAPPGISYDDWVQIGERFQLYAKASNWWLGDWLLVGERRFGDDRASAAVDLSGLEYSTVTAARWLAGRIEPARRRPDLSWSHHREVGSLPPVEQDRWLETAAVDGMTRDELRKAVKEATRAGVVPEAPPADDDDPEATDPANGTAAPVADAPGDVSPLPPRSEPITAGYDDSPEFLEACRLRFGETRGAEVFAFVQTWVGRHAPKLAEAIQ